MANETKKISVNKFEQAIPNTPIVEKALDGVEDVVMAIKKTLSLTEMLEFVDEIANSCVDMEEGVYIPQAYDFAIRVATLTKYANFRMPASLEKQYQLVYETSAFEQVISEINERQFNDIISSIDKKISYMLGVLTSSAALQVRDIISKFGEIADVSMSAFGGIDPNEVQSVMKGLSTASVDSEKVAETILKAMKKEAENE